MAEDTLEKFVHKIFWASIREIYEVHALKSRMEMLDVLFHIFQSERRRSVYLRDLIKTNFSVST